MKRALVLFGAGLVTLILLLAAAAGVFLAVVNPNDYREEISAAVSAATGRRVVLQGNLSLALFPRPELRTGPFQIQDLPDFGAEPFLSAQGASLRLALGPLLRGRVEAQEILLDGLRLKLALTATGRKNWESGQNGTQDAEELREEGEAKQSLNLLVQTLRLSAGEVVYRNLAEGTSLRLEVNALELRDVAPDTDMSLEARGGMEDSGTGLRASFSLRGSLRLGADRTASGKVENLSLKLGDNGPQAGLGGSFALARERLRLELTGKVEGASVQGQADLDLPGSRGPGLGIRGNLSLGSLDLDALVLSCLGPKGPVRENTAGGREDPAPLAADKKGLPPALRFLDADLRLSANTLLAARLPLTLVSVQVKAKGGQVEIPYSLKLFQGTISGVATADLRPAVPGLGLEGEAHNLAAGDLLAAVSGKRSLSGLLSGSLSLRGQGLEARSILSSLSGKAQARILEGEVQGFTLIPPGLPGIDALPVNFPLKNLALTLVLNRGLAEVRQAEMLSPLISARGSGTANVATGVLNLLLRFRLADKSPEIPLRVEGTFARPTYGVDLAEMGKNAARAVLETPGETVKTLRDLLPGK
ncbi:MAG: AsmA family protein [Desulfovibrio sp.]|jgi:AsmA protein|nr:AsmA family protein [Desulfovibrio sp.]